MIELKCPTCGHQLRIPSKYAGQTGGCKYCKGRFIVPEPDSAFAPAAPEPVPPFQEPGEGPVTTSLEDLKADVAGTADVAAPAAGLGSAPAALGEGDEHSDAFKETQPWHDSLGCLFWGMAFFVPVVGLVLAIRVPKEHPHRTRAIVTTSLSLVLFLVIFGLTLVPWNLMAPALSGWDVQGYNVENAEPSFFGDDDHATQLLQGQGLNCDVDTFVDYLERRANLDTVRNFITCGVDVNARASNGNTALVAALQRQGDPSVVIAILDAGADTNLGALNAQGKPFTTPLIAACEQDDASNVMGMIKHWGADPNLSFESRGLAAPLHIAAQKGTYLLVWGLLDNGADPNRSDAGGMTPLMYAAREGHEEAARTLIEFNAVTTLVDHQGRTALMHAQAQGHNELLGLLAQ